MATVHQSAAFSNQDTATWPCWTDEGTWVETRWATGPRPDGLPDLDVESWPEYDSPEPPDAATDLAGLFASWAAWHRAEATLDDWGAHTILADEVRSIGLVAAYGRHATVASYLAAGYRRAPDLATLVVAPEGLRTSPLASALDDQARRYLARGTEPARLVAWLCKDLAQFAEDTDSHTAADYYDAMAAYDEASATVAEEYAMADLIEF